MGYFDAVATRYGCQVQGATHVCVTNLDVLGYLNEIKVCVAYEVDGKRREHFPNITRLEHSVPIYETLKGWNCDISGVRNYDDLTQRSQSLCRSFGRTDWDPHRIGFQRTQSRTNHDQKKMSTQCSFFCSFIKVRNSLGLKGLLFR